MAEVLLQLRCARRNLRKERVFRDRANPLEEFDDERLIERYRMPRFAILNLVRVLKEDLEHPTRRSVALPVQLQVLVPLRLYAKGTFLSETGDIHGVSRATACVSVSNVSKAICRNLNLIKFPTNQAEVINTKLAFSEIANFPNVIGVVDGSLIPICGPSEDEPSYVCRKGFHAINIQATTDANMRFTNIVAKFPGSVHDAYIWSTCALNQQLQGGVVDGWLLGDSGYPLRPWLLTPRLNPTTRSEKAYNRSFKTTRCVVERAFGVLKSRFRCLHKSAGGLLFKPAKCCSVIQAVCQLHNYCIDLRLPEPELEPDEAGELEDDSTNYYTGIEDGKAVQERLIATRFI